jgi:hypothetical protein
MPSPKLSLSGTLSFNNSRANERGAGGLSLNTLNQIFNTAQSVTGRAAYTISPIAVAELKANYSHFTSRSSYLLDTFGGAILPDPSVFTQPAVSGESALFSADLNARSTRLASGEAVTSIQRQFNLLGAATIVSGVHTMKFGADYRRIFPTIGLRQQESSFLFDGVSQALTGNVARSTVLSRSPAQRPVFNYFSLFGQDEMRVTPHLVLTYGMRWEVSPAPSASDGQDALAVDQVEDPTRLTVLPRGTRLWKTRYGNFAPRVGVAYQPHDEGMIIRGGFGILYDLGNGAIGDAYADSYPFLNGQSEFNVPFTPGLTTPVNPAVISMPFSAFDPELKVPYSIEWSVSVQRPLGAAQNISAAYVGNAGRRLLLTTNLLSQNANFDFLRLTNNGASSHYHSLQVQFSRRFTGGLGAMVGYTWAKSIDNFSEDSAASALLRSPNSDLERGPSDFDIRHTLTGYVSYELPVLFASGFRNLVTRKWSLDSVFNLRSAPPVNVVYGVPTSFGFLYLRPDLISTAPLYLNDVNAAGGRRINAAAFSVPQDLRQGSLGRNVLRGFPLSQVNLALRRRFNFNESVSLTLGAEAYNLFNHPNFAAPAGSDASIGTRFATASALQPNPAFGQSYTNAARNQWGIPGSSFGANYYAGGPRTMKLSAKLEF